MRGSYLLVLVACASPPVPQSPEAAGAPVTPAAPAIEVPDARDEKAELAAAHRVLEAEQQAAYAATCDEPEPRTPRPRCLPSCYATEPADPRAGTKLSGAVEIRALVCEPRGGPGTGPYLIANEVDRAALALRPVRGRFPPPHARGTSKAAVVEALAATHRPRLARGDVLRVGRWRRVKHPVTRERLRCATVSHFTRARRRPLDGCGADGSLACEATGNAAARGINVVRYRLAEARRLRAAGNSGECQTAALEAVAVARGLPRWRQYMKINIATWTEYAGYRTRFDGTLDEDALFATAAALGNEAEAIHVACGGPAGSPTAVAQEQSFHTCW
jgi:hypothetical protein